MSTKEVLTLQLGNYSNYVGTHFWNTQYDALQSDGSEQNCYIDHSKLFRESSNYRQHNVVPRMIALDFKQNLRTLKLDGSFEASNQVTNGTHEPHEENNLSDTDERSFVNGTDDECVTYREKKIEKNDPKDHDFNVDDNVKSWSDFMSYTLNQNSLQTLKNRFENDNTFTYHGLGCSEYEKLKYDIEDKLHYWIEECNIIDGFMLFTDIHDGFCGLTSKLLEELHDEYNNKAVLPFVNFLHSGFQSDSVIPWLNVGLTFQSFKNHGSMFVVQGLQEGKSIPNLSYRPEVPYHSSAILASAIDTALLPWRQFNGSELLEVCKLISQDRFKICTNSIGFPPLKDFDGLNLFERMLTSKGLYGEFMTDLFPFGNSNSPYTPLKPITQSVVFRNTCDAIVPSFERKTLQSLKLNYDIFQGQPKNFLEYFIEKWYPPNGTVSKLTYNKQNLSFSYPLSSMLESSDVKGRSVISSLFTSASFYDALCEVINKVQSADIKKLPLVQEYGLDHDSHKELVEDLYNLAEEYNLNNPYNDMCN